MSAYGVIKRASNDDPLPPTLWPGSKLGTYVTVHHLTLPTAKKLDGLLEYLNIIFAKEVEEGRTYPQEGEMTQDTFEAYFFAADVFIGIIRQPTHEDITQRDVEIAVEEARAGRPWEHCVAGYYYIKPNYPGRSSHICNAGFVVPPIHRGAGYGSVLAESYVHYAPKLGYQASVFNLVYVNNAASIKLWEKLNFIKAGKIPRAGRLRRKDGEGEEYVDAWVLYKSFIES